MCKKFTKEEFEGCLGRFIPYADDNYNFYDIVDTEKLEYLDFTMPYQDLDPCNHACNILNGLDYLLEEKGLK